MKSQEYLVRWVGYPDPTWMKYKALLGAADLVEEYLWKYDLQVHSSGIEELEGKGLSKNKKQEMN